MKNKTQHRQLKRRRLVEQFLKGIFGYPLTQLHRVKAKGGAFIHRFEPPYLLLANHVNFWDPIYLGTYVPHPICFVVTDAVFRSPLMKYVLKLMKAIPKTKGVAEYATIRRIFQVKHSGGIIGIYPEGIRSWDGHTQPLLYSTAKLVKLLRIPVVIGLFRGAHLALPRWARHGRKGRITLSFREGIPSSVIRSMSVDEVYSRISSLLDYDEFEYQRKVMIPFKGKRLAEYLESFLFICPACESIAALVSVDATFSCKKCGYSVEYTEYGFFTGPDRIPKLDNPRAWNEWQLECLRRKIDGLTHSDIPLLADHRIWLYTGFKHLRLQRLRFGRMLLYRNRIEFIPRRKARIIFDLDFIEGINVQPNENLEFYYKSVLYHFRSASRRVSAYKWMKAVTFLLEARQSVGTKKTMSPAGKTHP